MMNWSFDGQVLECAEWSPSQPHGPPLVLLHEGLGSVGLWKDFPGRLSEHTNRRVVAYSRLGHGCSDRLTGPRTPDFMHREAEILRCLLTDNGLTDAILLGHSDGGSIALLYASRHPTTGIVLMAPHVFVESLSLESIRAAGVRFAQSDLPQRLGRYHDDVEHTFRAWHEIWTAPEFESWNIETETARITAPMLVIQGQDDEYGTAAQYEAIVRAAPQTDQLILSRCGHSPHRDRPQAVLSAVAGFVAAIEP